MSFASFSGSSAPRWVRQGLAVAASVALVFSIPSISAANAAAPSPAPTRTVVAQSGPGCAITSADTVKSAISQLSVSNGIPWTLGTVGTAAGPSAAPGSALTGRCPALSYALAVPTANFAGSPVAVLLFTPGGFVRTATPQPLPFTKIVGLTANSVTVEYRWMTFNGDSAALPGGGPSEVTFTSNGAGITQTGVAPAQ